MSCECVTGGFICGKCGSDDPPKVSSAGACQVRCSRCGYEVEAQSVRDAMRKWEEKASVKDAGGGVRKLP